MFRFEHPDHLYALLLLPALVGVYLLYRYLRRRALVRFGDSALVAQLTPGVSKYRPALKFGLLLLATAALVLGWANPQWGGARQEVKRQGIDVFVALDISQSMLAEDISPNRLERAKRYAQQLVDNLAGNNIGVILFTCNAYVAAPLTTDYAFAELVLATADPSQAGEQGTALATAIDQAQRSFSAESPNHRAIILFTDGEDHAGEAEAAAQAARENGTLLFTVGVGLPEGSFVPASVGGRPDYLRDATDQPVRSRLDEATLQAIAEAGGGAYFNLSNNPEQLLNDLRARIDQIEKRNFEQRAFTDFTSYYHYLVALALLLLVVEYLLPHRRPEPMA